MILLTEFRPSADELAGFEKRKRVMSTTRCNLRVILGMALLTVCGAVLAQDYTIDWHTIGGGGDTSTGGTLVLSGTIGHHDPNDPATAMTGGNFSRVGGFWAVAVPLKTNFDTLVPEPGTSKTRFLKSWLRSC